MLLPLLLNNLLAPTPPPVATTDRHDGVTTREYRKREYRNSGEDIRKRILQEDDEIFEILKTFMTHAFN